jgi:hypothetical protein
MKTNYLFPNRFKIISGILFVASFIMLTRVLENEDKYAINTEVFAVISDAMPPSGIMSIGATRYFKWMENSVTDELLILLMVVSGIVFAFSKEKHEDEMVAAIRLKCLAWSTIANYAIFLLAYLYVYGMAIFSVIMHAAFSQLVIFIVLFRYNMFRFNLQRQDEE